MNRECGRLACLALVLGTAIQFARAQEFAPPCPPTAYSAGQCLAAEHPLGGCAVDPAATLFIERATRALTAEFGNGLRFRVTMPYPETSLPGACGGTTCCEEMLSKIGVGAAMFEHPLDHLKTSFFRLGCPCVAGGECVCATAGDCGSDCAARTDKVTCTSENGHRATLTIKHASHETTVDHHDPLQLMQHIAGLMADKAAAQTALEVRKQADEQIGELFEALAEVMADNAALDAKLDALTEQRKLVEKLAEATVENAKLKAQVELAAERAEITRGTHALALENERLKHRLADLEQKQSAETARTATKSSR